MAYKVQIFDPNQNFKARIKNLATFDKQGTYLEYGQKLSSWGIAKFRVSTKDPLFTQIGDLVTPWANHVKILKGNSLVWQGVIVRNPSRNQFYIDVEARTYEYLLNTILVQHDTNLTLYPDDGSNFKHFDSGGMDAAVKLVLSQAKTSAGPASFLNSIQPGNIINPNFPAGYQDLNGNDISGQPWDFAKEPVKFNYNTAYYVLNAFGIYSRQDLQIDLNLNLNYMPMIGTQNNNTLFTYGPTGNIEDYNLPMDGTKMVNSLTGLAVDNKGNVLTSNQLWQDSVNQMGQIQNAAAFTDVKAQGSLDTRTKEQVRHRATMPAEMQLLLNDRAYPLGQWNIGDVVPIIINDHVNQINQSQQIVAYTVVVKNTGQEAIKMTTNIPPVV